MQLVIYQVFSVLKWFTYLLALSVMKHISLSTFYLNYHIVKWEILKYHTDWEWFYLSLSSSHYMQQQISKTMIQKKDLYTKEQYKLAQIIVHIPP